MLKFFNTLSRKKEIFNPIRNGEVGLYTCGPTVYWFAHIGNLRTYIFEDILKRVLEYNGFKVKHVMNITDVGHLTSDADTGEDKMEKGAKREGKTAWEIAEFYTNVFKEDLKNLNIKEPTIWTKATDYIKEQVELIEILEKRGFTYKISDGIYFDSSKLKNYGKLSGKKPKKIKAGARIKIVSGKRNPTDFALWKFSPAGVKRQMEWNSPWGKGFPGWHTECVVMSVKHLGIPFDIHTGGIDHIPIHHTNEIAQAEAAFCQNLARFWLHGEFLILKEGKMAKSKGNITTLKDLIEKGINPLAYRYLCLTTHYRAKLTFSWKSLESAQNALQNLRLSQTKKDGEYASSARKEKEIKKFLEKVDKEFLEAINNDLDTPKALSLLHSIYNYEKKLDDKFEIDDKAIKIFQDYLLKFDTVLGLKLNTEPISHYIMKAETGKFNLGIPKEIIELAKERERLRKEGKWQASDGLRKKIKELGYQIEDTKEGPKIRKL